MSKYDVKIDSQERPLNVSQMGEALKAGDAVLPLGGFAVWTRPSAPQVEPERPTECVEASSSI